MKIDEGFAHTLNCMIFCMTHNTIGKILKSIRVLNSPKMIRGKNNASCKLSYGFTLVEILVSIAIIGVLSSVVFGSISGMRESGKDGRIKAEAHNIRIANELYFDDYGTYDLAVGNGVCEQEIVIESLKKVYPDYDPATATLQNGIQCNDQDDHWVLFVPLHNGGMHWCVDGVGNAREVDGGTNYVNIDDDSIIDCDFNT